MSIAPTLDEFVAGARAWLAANAEPRPERVERTLGRGLRLPSPCSTTRRSRRTRRSSTAARAWQQRKSDAGYASIDWSPEFGGAGLPVGVRPGVLA